MTDYSEIYEIDTIDVQMRIFIQSLSGAVRTWFRGLTSYSDRKPKNSISVIPK